MLWRYHALYIDVANIDRVKGFEWLPREHVEGKLNVWGENEWELVSIIPATTWHHGEVGEEDTVMVLAILKKPV